ncbi:MAG: Hsp20/alpha crystallin family protein [Deferrisomatales bacterium]|nr:Hsp20/alpha crystallin family protein [Deferrisomatales bacterium]
MGKGSDEVFRDLMGLQETLYRLFDEQGGRDRTEGDSVPSHWCPAVDIREADECFVLSAELPGMIREDIHLEITDDRLVLRGERLLPADPAVLSYHRIERPNGIFQRVFRLPSVVDPGGASATYRAGVLRVTLPKRAGVEGQAIPVQVE